MYGVERKIEELKSAKFSDDAWVTGLENNQGKQIYHVAYATRKIFIQNPDNNHLAMKQDLRSLLHILRIRIEASCK